MSELDTLIIIPTFNEAENIARLIPDLLALPAEIGVIVVDDNSPDGTGALAEGIAAQNPGRVRVIHRPAKLGLGTAYLAGYRQALALGARQIMTMDSDFSHHPRHIPAMIERAREADLVIGSRYVDGGGTLNCPFYRRALSYGANAFAKTLLGLRARDATAGFRLYRRQVLESIPLNQIRASGYSFLVEMLYLVQRAGWRVAEVPILFEDRSAGASKISRQEIFRAVLTVLRLSGDRLRDRARRR